MSTRRLVALVIVVVLVLGAGAWLLQSSDDDDPFAAYCSEVEDRRGELGAALAAGERLGLIRALPTFELLAEKAPEDLRDEWKIVIDRVTEVRDAFADAKVDPATYDPEKPPKDLPKADRDAIEAAAVRLGSQETKLAFAGVSQQARDVCKTPLSL